MAEHILGRVLIPSAREKELEALFNAALTGQTNALEENAKPDVAVYKTLGLTDEQIRKMEGGK